MTSELTGQTIHRIIANKIHRDASEAINRIRNEAVSEIQALTTMVECDRLRVTVDDDVTVNCDYFRCSNTGIAHVVAYPESAMTSGHYCYVHLGQGAVCCGELALDVTKRAAK